jgi:hypothetical protein
MEVKNLPPELLLLTREFLHSLATPWVDDVQRFIRRESEWSWRNFLLMSNNEDWKRIRKHCMIWSLNRFASSKYMRDACYQCYLQSRMVDPTHQLYLCCYNLGEEIRGREGCASASYRCDPLLSFDRLHSLSLFSCHEITSISAPTLKRLKLVCCRGITDVTSMGSLTVVSLIDCPNETLSLLPLEQLERLHYQGMMTPFHACLPRLLKLEDLIICPSNWQRDDSKYLPFLPLPHLKSLAQKV